MNQAAAHGKPPHHLKISADLAHVAEVRDWLGEVGRSISLPDSRIFDLQVAASEAVANGIEHAASEVEIVAWVLPDRLLIEVTNDGLFAPGIYKDKEGRRRGLGLPLMVSLADQVHVSRLRDNRTKVSLTFLTAAREPNPDAGGRAPTMSGQKPARRELFESGTNRVFLFLPLPLLVIAAAVLSAAGIDGVHESAGLLTAFNTLFTSAAGLLVAYLAARTYLVGGSSTQIALGSGAVVLALGALMAGPMVSDPNDAITVYNTAVLVSGGLFAIAGFLALGRASAMPRLSARWELVLAYAASVAFVAAVAVLASINALPAFFAPGVGTTRLREVVLGVGVLFLVVAAVCFVLVYRRRPSRFALFAAASFAAFAVALAVLLLAQPLNGSPVNWLARIGTWLGGLYLLAGALSVDHARTWLLPLERNLREAETRYEGLVDLNPDAVWIRSEGRFVFANEAAAKLFGYASAAELLGKDVDETFHPETRAAQRERVALVYAGGTSPATEEMFLRADGSVVDVSIFRTRVEYTGRLAIEAVARDITEQKRAEEAIAAANEQLTQTLENVEELSYSLDYEWKFLWISETAAAQYGVKRVDMIGRNIWEMFPALIGTAFEKHYRAAMEHREIRRFEAPGTITGAWYHVSVFPSPPGITVFGMDITESKQAEKALRENEERLRLVLDNSLDGINLLDLSTGKYIIMNPAQAMMTGFGMDELNGMSAEEAYARVHPDDRSASIEQQKRVAAGEAVDEPVEYRWRVKSGEYRWFSDRRQLVRDKQGKPVALVGISRDITERKQVEEARSESDANLRSLFGGSPDAIFMAVPGGPIIAANPAACAMFEMTEDELCAAGRAGIEDPDDPAPLAALRERAQSGKVRYEATHVRKSGARFPSEVTSVLVEGGARSIVIIRDITPHRLAEEALRGSEERYRALAEENERLYRQQLDIAEKLQLALLNIPSEIGPVCLGHLYRSATEAARVGGDFYDVFEVKDGQIAVLIGDVSGHGIQAARTATLVKDVVHAFTHQSLHTHEVLRHTNKLLLEKKLAGFVTVFLGVLDQQTGHLRYSVAGHPDALLRRASGTVERLGSGSSPLGVYPDPTWKTHSIQLEVDDILLLYTDGVIEARSNGQFFGEQRLESILKRRRVTPERLPQLVLDEVLAFSQGTLKDDVAVLALSLREVVGDASAPPFKP